MRNVVIILAGGVGSRMGCEVPKQFMEIGGRKVIECTVDMFERNVLIDEIAVVMNPMYVKEMEDIVERNRWGKVACVLNGGSERYMSTLSALEWYRGRGEMNMLFHDAVRPFVSDRIINDVVSSLEVNDAVGVAVPVTDTIFEVDDSCVRSVLRRDVLRRAQTPQGFKYSVIARAYEKCGIVARYLPEVRIAVVDGDKRNIKITYKEDLLFAERLFNV